MTDQRSAILEGLADGRSLRTICKEDGMPGISTVMRWLADDAEWREHYARARLEGDEAMAEDIQEIADRADLEANDKRVRIDARKWLLAKRQPKKYGERLDLHQNTEVVHRHDLSALDPDELDTLERLSAKAADRGRDQGGEGATRADSVH